MILTRQTSLLGFKVGLLQAWLVCSLTRVCPKDVPYAGCDLLLLEIEYHMIDGTQLVIEDA